MPLFGRTSLRLPLVCWLERIEVWSKSGRTLFDLNAGVTGGRRTLPGSHFLESLAAQPMTDLGQRGPFSIGKEQPALDLGFENPVFSDEIFIASQTFLVDRSSDVGQQARPIHSDPPTLDVIESKLSAGSEEEKVI